MPTSLHGSLPYLPALLAAAAVMLSACASSNSGGSGHPRPATSDQAYAGPSVAIDSATGPHHLIVLTAPSPGWVFSFDQVGPGSGDAFVTIRRPNPALLYPQVIVEQKMDSTVDSSQPLRVYARVLDFEEKAGSQAYRLAKSTAR